jgi:predicted CopG family antitoxin
MATKTLTITTDAYDMLAQHKQPHESFSDVIRRIARRRSLSELRGLITEKEAVALKHERHNMQKDMEVRLAR